MNIPGHLPDSTTDWSFKTLRDRDIKMELCFTLIL